MTTSVNPSPVEYWGSAVHYPNLAKLFSGHAQLVTAPGSEAGAPRTTTVIFLCNNHKSVVADPDAYSSVEDTELINGVHACALNGFVDTLKVLIEEGGALPFKKARGGLDALMIARRRGHESVLNYLSTFEGQGGAQKLIKIQQRVAERRRREAAERALRDGDGTSQSSEEETRRKGSGSKAGSSGQKHASHSAGRGQGRRVATAQNMARRMVSNG